MEMELVVLLQNLGFDSSQLCRKSQFFCWTILDDDDDEEEEDEEEDDDDDFPLETNLWPRVGKIRYIIYWPLLAPVARMEPPPAHGFSISLSTKIPRRQMQERRSSFI
jgi:hypothetical protein